MKRLLKASFSLIKSSSSTESGFAQYFLGVLKLLVFKVDIYLYFASAVWYKKFFFAGQTKSEKAEMGLQL